MACTRHSQSVDLVSIVVGERADPVGLTGSEQSIDGLSSLRKPAGTSAMRSTGRSRSASWRAACSNIESGSDPRTDDMA